LVHPFVGFPKEDELLDSDKLQSSSSALDKTSVLSNETTYPSNSPSKVNSDMQTIPFSGELWGDKHYHFELYARWYEPFVIVWAVESKSAH
jgi:hypothetical protein